MVEYIKNMLWERLKAKEVSLAMIFNKEGDILWHRGRDIKGKTVDKGEGFSKSCLRDGIQAGKRLEEEDVVIVAGSGGLPRSAAYLNIKSLMILPLGRGYFLYVDSGIKETFSEADREICRNMGALLGELIDGIRRKEEDIGGITGTSPSMRVVRDLVLKYSLEEEPVLLGGETGSGKNHIAELLHHYSGRKGKFVTIHTPGIPEHLFESEVFGHKKGAFTDAQMDKPGLVEMAREGTLFFDEIAEVPYTFQSKLLRFIETKRYYKLGDPTEYTADVRILAATNLNLGEAMENKEFRRDLYFRLQVLEIKLPPLRERPEDIRPLVLMELKHLRGKKIGPGFWEALEGYDWPGNVRELKSVLIRAGIHAGTAERITGEDIRALLQQGAAPSALEPPNEIQTAEAELQAGKTFWEAVKKPFLNRDFNRKQVAGIICRARERAGGKYKDMLPSFNLEPGEYHRFMTFINEYKLK